MGATMPPTKNSANLANTVAAIKPATQKSVTIVASAWSAETGGLVATCTVTGANSASAVDVLPSQALYSWMATNTVEAMWVENASGKFKCYLLTSSKSISASVTFNVRYIATKT